jgi:hypothetical protein
MDVTQAHIVVRTAAAVTMEIAAPPTTNVVPGVEVAEVSLDQAILQLQPRLSPRQSLRLLTPRYRYLNGTTIPTLGEYPLESTVLSRSDS